mmetsp:Transcript_166366/g.528559  ORF Transcript_166366/g.528559 Transcript_166366/m.528559 type:complete len:255 (-) Transcript_166366:714-1478(-)
MAWIPSEADDVLSQPRRTVVGRPLRYTHRVRVKEMATCRLWVREAGPSRNAAREFATRAGACFVAPCDHDLVLGARSQEAPQADETLDAERTTGRRRLRHLVKATERENSSVASVCYEQHTALLVKSNALGPIQLVQAISADGMAVSVQPRTTAFTCDCNADALAELERVLEHAVISCVADVEVPVAIHSHSRRVAQLLGAATWHTCRACDDRGHSDDIGEIVMWVASCVVDVEAKYPVVPSVCDIELQIGCDK